MHRDLARLTSHTFDLAVVGGGIYGLIVACDAVQRGLDVVLVERHDFGSGTSFNHLRTIHGGLRYLQTLDVARARESITERRTLAKIAPAAIRPLPFALPLFRSLTKGPLAMRFGLLLDRAVGNDRNVMIAETHHLPAGRVLGYIEALKRFPELSNTPLLGAAVWYDYVTSEPDRLTFAWAAAAAAHGAMLANYVEVSAPLVDRGRVVGLSAIDRRSDHTFEIAARCTVNATGALIDRLPAKVDARIGLPMIKAMNLVTRREASDHAVGGRAASGKHFFMVPWQGRAVFGTWESTHASRPDDLSVDRHEIDAFLGELNQAFPTMRLTRDDIVVVHRGVVPAVRQPNGSFALEGREQIHDHAFAGIEGFVSVAGTKYTTARAVAEKVVDLVLQKLDRALVPCRTSTLPLPVELRAGDEGLRAAAREEMVETLEDAVVRRTSIGALGHPGDEILKRSAAIVGEVLGWDGRRQREEVDAMWRFYGTLNAWKT